MLSVEVLEARLAEERFFLSELSEQPAEVAAEAAHHRSAGGLRDFSPRYL